MDKPVKETLTVEFKSDRKCLPMDDLYKELVAMANTDGGVLCLGIEDDGVVTGVHPQHTDIIEMTAKVQTHMLSSKVYALSGNEAAYIRQRGLTTIQEKNMIIRRVETFKKITRSEAAELCKCSANHAYYILNSMVDEGTLRLVKHGKYTYYTKNDSQ